MKQRYQEAPKEQEQQVFQQTARPITAEICFLKHKGPVGKILQDAVFPHETFSKTAQDIDIGLYINMCVCEHINVCVSVKIQKPNREQNILKFKLTSKSPSEFTATLKGL